MPPNRRDSTTTSSGMMSMEDMIEKLLKGDEASNSGVNTMKRNLSSMSQLVNSHSTSIKKLEQQMNQLSATLN